MEIRYTVTEHDYIQYNLYHHGHSPSSKRTIALFRFGVPVALVILSLLTIRHHNLLAWLPAIIIAVIWFALTPGLFRRSIGKNVKKLMYEGRCSEFIGDFSVALQENNIRYAGQGQTIETVYSRVERVEHDAERLYIYIGSLSAIIIPIRFFQDDAQKQAFLDLLERKRREAGSQAC